LDQSADGSAHQNSPCEKSLTFQSMWTVCAFVWSSLMTTGLNCTVHMSNRSDISTQIQSNTMFLDMYHGIMTYTRVISCFWSWTGQYHGFWICNNAI